MIGPAATPASTGSSSGGVDAGDAMPDERRQPTAAARNRRSRAPASPASRAGRASASNGRRVRRRAPQPVRSQPASAMPVIHRAFCRTAASKRVGEIGTHRDRSAADALGHAREHRPSAHRVRSSARVRNPRSGWSASNGAPPRAAAIAPEHVAPDRAADPGERQPRARAPGARRAVAWHAPPRTRRNNGPRRSASADAASGSTGSCTACNAASRCAKTRSSCAWTTSSASWSSDPPAPANPPPPRRGATHATMH